MKVKAYAKLNLTLNVLGAQNGYHNIDSLATTVNIFDVVEVAKRADKRVTVSGLPSVATERNTAYKAACGFIRYFDTYGVDISIEKSIPFGAGMGGSSADAAAVIYCMCKLFYVDLNDGKVKRLCAEIGSDISFMLRGGLGRLRGKGDDVEFGKTGSSMCFALTTFDTSMSTAEVYSQFDKLPAEQAYVDNGALMNLLQKGKAQGVAERFNNHLQAAAVSLSDYACDYLQFCANHGLSPNMTGSGSAYYVACCDEPSANDIAKLLNANGFKTVVCQSVNCGIELMRNA